MSKACLVITAVVTEGRSQGEVARAYGVSSGAGSRGWLPGSVRAALAAAADLTAGHPRGDGQPDHRAADTSASASVHAQTPVLMLVRDLHIRVINAATGEILRDLTLDPTRNYQPAGRPPGTPRRRENPGP